MTDAEKILTEFVNDCEAVGGGPHLGYHWPDLLITYNKAKRLLRATKTQKRASVPVTYIMEPIGVDASDEASAVLFYCSDSCRCAGKAHIDGSIQIGQSEDWIDGAQCDECGIPLSTAAEAHIA